MKSAIKIGLLCLITNICCGQITIDFPLNKAVYQRNNTNKGSLVISGKFTDITTVKIEVRLVNPTTGLAVTGFDWQTLVSYPTLGHYMATLQNVPGGWYVLQTRNLSNNGTVLSTATLERVGIGEVFLIAGQSNSEGMQDYASVSAQNETVVSHNYNDYTIHNSTNTTEIPPLPVFSKIEYNSSLGIRGNSSWAYGKLGDLLTNRLGVPVAFFNAGASGTSSKNWQESANGQATVHEYTGFQVGNLVGLPYLHFQNMLKYYAQNFGVRSVLWHQGETDKDRNVSTTDYFNRLSFVLAKSREHFNPNLNWMIGQVSYFNGSVSSQIIGGQNLTVQQNLSKNFYGPLSDQVQPRRNDTFDNLDVHFEGASLIGLANEWDARLNANFFSTSSPIEANNLQGISITCGQNNYTLAAPAGFAQYKWVKMNNSGSLNFEQTADATTQTIARTSGTYICYLIDNLGKINFSQVIDLNTVAYFCLNNLYLPQCSSFDYVSDLPFLNPPFNYNTTEDFGPVRRDLSNENNPIRLDGITYSKGLGVHAKSIVEFSLTGKNYQTFTAKIGLDDEMSDPNCGNIVFKVYHDNQTVPIYTSPEMKANTPTISINIPIAGYSSLRLEVDDNGVYFCDHADWADAKFTFASPNQIPVVTSDKTLVNAGQTIILSVANCTLPNIVKWSTGIYSNPYIVTPTVTQLYSASCITPNVCETPYSLPITVSVIPDCTNSYNLISPTNDFNVPTTNLTFRTSQKITGTNKITNSAKIIYDAKQSIELLPGFIAENGTLFTAKIEGCNN